ncbi:lactate/malate family dehydrogenase [Marinisporobacter balticus]|uniref:Malate/lactate dehydrogenase n=1 Tax=Marinisporobacter balticus TaxID=2018667 RepID=A0A4R2KXQ5_9FIRM|nr:lactate dehydrogenase [Marinisporobacter balticus]TCO79391.1 malate/lactate dehydrogenase [Marinisporobacter balticus]
MYYYTLNNKILISTLKYAHLKEVSEDYAKTSQDTVYLLHRLDLENSRRNFCVSDPSLAFLEEENIDLLKKQEKHTMMPNWLIIKMNERKVTSINTSYPNWQDVLDLNMPNKWKIHVVGMGDVGGTLITGLRLLGANHISEIGIYDRNENHLKRWEHEVNQVLPPCCEESIPNVSILHEEDIFDCDMFVFCISVGVPPVGDEKKDVRIVQFEGNAKILKAYAKMARNKNFRGIFSVVSDPVDLLCKSAFLESNKDDHGHLDFKGLGAEQIRGYGLGVMHARAAYYAKRNPQTHHYLTHGRAFGPHGEGLIIADNIHNYNENLSFELTEKAKKANLQVRAAGFKPFIAPALSSGSYSILATIKGQWHYSATYMGGVFMGAKNRLHPTGIEIERLDLPKPLFTKLENTFERLRNIL